MASYYVSPTGSDGAAGNDGAPWATFAHALTVATSGDTIYIKGVINERCVISGAYTAAGRLTVLPHPTLGGAVDGQFVLPTGTAALTAPDGTEAVFSPLVSITGNNVTWAVDVRNSRGRGIGINGTSSSARNTGVIVQNCWVDFCRNACINIQDSNNVQITSVTASHGGCFYRIERDPSVLNWPVCFNIIRCDSVTVDNCTTYEQWGEGFALGRDTTNSTVEGMVSYNCMSVGLYLHRCQHCICRRNLVVNDGTFINRANGISVQNEANFSGTSLNVLDLLIEDNIVVGHRYNFAIGASQGTGDAITDVRVINNSFINAQQRQGASTWAGVFLNAINHVNITIYGNVIYQSTGTYTNAGGSFGTYTVGYNTWIGLAAGTLPQAALQSATDLTGVTLLNPNSLLTMDHDLGYQYVPTTNSQVPLHADATNVDYFDSPRSDPTTIGAVLYGSSPPGPPEPPPAGGTSVLGIGRAAANTSTGLQTIDITGLSEAPKLIVVVVSSAVTDNTAAAPLIACIGMATGSAAYCFCNTTKDAQTTTKTRRFVSDNRVVYFKDPDGTVEAEATVSSLTQSTVVLNWVDAPPAGYIVEVAAFAAVNAYLSKSAITLTQDASVTVTTGQTTHMGLMLFNGRAVPNTAGNSDNILSIGFLGNTTSLLQKCFGFFSDNGVATTDTAARVTSNRIASVTSTTGAAVYSLEASNPTSTTIDIYTRGGTPSVAADFVFAALEFSGVDVFVGTSATPTATGVYSHTGFGMIPGAYGVIGTTIQTVDSSIDTADSGAFGIGFGTANAQWFTGWADEDATTPSNTQSITDNVSVLLPQDDGTAGLAAAFSAFSSGQIDLNYSAVLAAARQFIFVGIEASATVVNLTGSEFGEDMDLAATSVDLRLTVVEDGDGEEVAALTITSSNLALSAIEDGEGTELATLTLSFDVNAPLRILSLSTGSSRISIAIHEPLISGTRQIDELSTQITAYEHRIERVGGYWAATIRVNERQSILEEWYETGLGRRIVTYSPFGHVIWEGFVNSIELNLGGLSVSIGPLLNIVNRAKLVYSYIDASSGTAILGIRAQTEWMTDLTSQAKYGTLTKVLSSGGTTPTLADTIVNEYLSEFAQPIMTQEGLGGNTGESYMTLECLGYAHMLNTYVYNSTTTGLQNLSAKLTAVVNSEPNAFITHDFSRIATNTLQEPAFDNDDNVAWGLIKSMLSKGGLDDDGDPINYLFGIYAERKPVYEQTPTEVGYYQSLGDARRRILSPSGQVVEPWDAQPGKWLFIPDLLVGRVPNSTELEKDPRAQYIENVTFTAPYSVTLQGMKVRRLDQRLARLGLAGIGG